LKSTENLKEAVELYLGNENVQIQAPNRSLRLRGCFLTFKKFPLSAREVIRTLWLLSNNLFLQRILYKYKGNVVLLDSSDKTKNFVL